MANSASAGSSSENISHFTAIRVRVTGSGNLKLKVYSFDDVYSQNLVPLAMRAQADVVPTRLCNFTTQHASFEGKTTEPGEHFRINRIIIFSKEVASSYPG